MCGRVVGEVQRVARPDTAPQPYNPKHPTLETLNPNTLIVLSFHLPNQTPHPEYKSRNSPAQRKGNWREVRVLPDFG